MQGDFVVHAVTKALQDERLSLFSESFLVHIFAVTHDTCTFETTKFACLGFLAH